MSITTARIRGRRVVMLIEKINRNKDYCQDILFFNLIYRPNSRSTSED